MNSYDVISLNCQIVKLNCTNLYKLPKCKKSYELQLNVVLFTSSSMFCFYGYTLIGFCC